MSREVGSLGEEGGCYCKCCLFQTGTCRVSRAFRRRKGENQRLSGNSEIGTFTGYPNDFCGLILYQTTSEMGCEADGSS